MKKLFLIISLLLIAGCVKQPIDSVKIGALTPIQQEIQDKPYLQLKAAKDKIPLYYETDDIRCVSARDCVNYGRVMAYDYVSNNKAKGEFLFFKGKYTNVKILNKGELKTEYAFYVGDNFSQEVDGVYEIEHVATTTIEAWNEQTKISLLDRIKNLLHGKKALADNYYAGSGDARTQKTGTSWAAAHDAVTGDICTTPNPTAVYAEAYKGSETSWTIQRALLPIDTSAIPADSVIATAALYIYVTNEQHQDNDTEAYVGICQTSQADPTAPTTADWDAWTATEGATAIRLENLTHPGYNAWNLNATGISWIQKAGGTTWTLLGAFEGHDITNDTIVGGNDTDSAMTASGSGYAGTSQDPYLLVTFATAASPSQESDIIIFD